MLPGHRQALGRAASHPLGDQRPATTKRMVALRRRKRLPASIGALTAVAASSAHREYAHTAPLHLPPTARRGLRHAAAVLEQLRLSRRLSRSSLEGVVLLSRARFLASAVTGIAVAAIGFSLYATVQRDVDSESSMGFLYAYDSAIIAGDEIAAKSVSERSQYMFDPLEQSQIRRVIDRPKPNSADGRAERLAVNAIMSDQHVAAAANLAAAQLTSLGVGGAGLLLVVTSALNTNWKPSSNRPRFK